VSATERPVGRSVGNNGRVMDLRRLRALNARWGIKQTRYAIEHPWREAVVFQIGLLIGALFSFVIVGFRSWSASGLGVLVGFAVVWYLRGRSNSGERGRERNVARLQRLEGMRTWT